MYHNYPDSASEKRMPHLFIIVRLNGKIFQDVHRFVDVRGRIQYNQKCPCLLYIFFYPFPAGKTAAMLGRI